MSKSVHISPSTTVLISLTVKETIDNSFQENK